MEGNILYIRKLTYSEFLIICYSDCLRSINSSLDLCISIDLIWLLKTFYFIWFLLWIRFEDPLVYCGYRRTLNQLSHRLMMAVISANPANIRCRIGAGGTTHKVSRLYGLPAIARMFAGIAIPTHIQRSRKLEKLLKRFSKEIINYHKFIWLFNYIYSLHCIALHYVRKKNNKKLSRIYKKKKKKKLLNGITFK